MKWLLFILLAVGLPAWGQTVDITGAWQTGTDEARTVLIIAPKQYAVSVYNLNDKTFAGTYGGQWRMDKNQFVELQEFNTLQPDRIGVEQASALRAEKEKLMIGTQEFTRVDKGAPGVLAGAWLITGRMTDKGLQTITPGARKTMKILSGTRFQWIAYNSETKEFFGTVEARTLR
ncbi:MAG: membrane or secreted protein [Cyclobacteriaceae bacterium]|nr:membrane or secreted protein [Cyclobacteriaceae bacterium]